MLATVVGIAAAAAFMVVIDLTLMRAVYREEGERRVLLGLLADARRGVRRSRGTSCGDTRWSSSAISIGGDAVPILGVRMPVGAWSRRGSRSSSGSCSWSSSATTSLGRGVRSVIQDEEGARLCGVNPSAVRTFVFGLSGALACMVAVTRSMTGPIGFSNRIEFTILALIVAVVGGLGSVPGAFLAGVLLGIVDRFSSTYIGTYVTTIVLLVCAALTILMRPSGLLGRPE